MRIYTKTGDSGHTGLFGGARISKADIRVQAIGAVDELNACLGLARSAAKDSTSGGLISRIQNLLFSLGADLATPPELGESHGRITIERVRESWTAQLESEIDRLESGLTPLTQFILPGGTPLASHLHVARAVCRRSERNCVALASESDLNPEIVRFLNRLSDLLFVMARAANAESGMPDVPWEKST